MKGQSSNQVTTRSAKKPYSGLALLGVLLLVSGVLVGGTREPNLMPHPNPSGIARTFSSSGSLDLGNGFFQNLGSNGRTCGTCHQESDGWTVTPPHIQARFDASGGTDPIFRTNDGSNCPLADVSTVEAKRAAYSNLLNKGLIRVSIGVPAGAEFTVVSISDPFGCPETTPSGLALFRRPLPATNLRFLTTVMWDGRESPAGRSLHDNLMSQANDATMGHAAGQPLGLPQQEAIVAFESAVSTAQAQGNGTGDLNSQGATGGPVALASQEFFVGINDPLGPPGQFDPAAMTLYSAWKNSGSPARQSVARGEKLFNSFPIMITGVAGLNDNPALGPAFMGTCTTCHNTPNVGNHSTPLPINIGVTDEHPDAPLDTTGLPVYVLRCNATGQIYRVTDPGRALITGKCADIGKTKGPILRGLASRAPYFHNGSAATLRDVIEFYDNRFHLGLSEQEKQDLVNFLQSL